MARRLLRLLGLGALAIAVLLGTVMSPLVFDAVLRRTGVPGVDLSNAGQAYGGISAILSLLALGGVIYATILQIQDQREGRLESNRNMHLELIKFGIENPGFLEVWRPIRDNPTASRRIAYANLIVTYWWHQFLVGVVPLQELQQNFNAFFIGSVAREYWADARGDWMSTDPVFSRAIDKRRLIFAQIANDAYQAATHTDLADVRASERKTVADVSEAATAAPLTAPTHGSRLKGISVGSLTAGAVIFAAGALAGQLLQRRAQAHSPRGGPGS